MNASGLRVVYARQYNIRFFGLQRLHPFDGCKYGRAWRLLCKRLGRSLTKRRIRPGSPARHVELRLVHTEEYLQELRSSKYLARALEVPQIARMPARLVDHVVLRPMRWAVSGTMLGAHAAIESGMALNLSGGYHHARLDFGHGFCVYSDIAMAIAALRRDGLLRQADQVVYLDLDAHQGDGVARLFFKDSRVMIFDMYNRNIFPADPVARRRIDCDLPLPSGCGDEQYLLTLRSELPRFLDALSRNGPPRLAIYNAGTDIFEGDPLGGMKVSAMGVLQRDQFVLEELTNRRIPWLMLPSGGYTRESHHLLAESAAWAVNRWDFKG